MDYKSDHVQNVPGEPLPLDEYLCSDSEEETDDPVTKFPPVKLVFYCFELRCKFHDEDEAKMDDHQKHFHKSKCPMEQNCSFESDSFRKMGSHAVVFHDFKKDTKLKDGLRLGPPASELTKRMMVCLWEQCTYKSRLKPLMWDHLKYEHINSWPNRSTKKCEWALCECETPILWNGLTSHVLYTHYKPAVAAADT